MYRLIDILAVPGQQGTVPPLHNPHTQTGLKTEIWHGKSRHRGKKQWPNSGESWLELDFWTLTYIFQNPIFSSFLLLHLDPKLSM